MDFAARNVTRVSPVAPSPPPVVVRFSGQIRRYYLPSDARARGSPTASVSTSVRPIRNNNGIRPYHFAQRLYQSRVQQLAPCDTKARNGPSSTPSDIVYSATCLSPRNKNSLESRSPAAIVPVVVVVGVGVGIYHLDLRPLTQAR